MEIAYFISDVHLGAHSKELERAKVEHLISFLEAIRKRADLLYIVGDLFDFWFEYNEVIPRVDLKILFQLHRLIESNVRIDYFAGNHDVWLGTHLEQEIGVRIVRGPLAVKHNSLNLFIAHGDGLAKGDKKTRRLNRIFKNRANVFLYKWLHPDIGIPLARAISRKSHEKDKDAHKSDYRDFALGKLAEGYDAVILGHTHQPIFERIQTKYYVNLGNWFRNFTFLELERDRLKLKTWASDSNASAPAAKLLTGSKV